MAIFFVFIFGILIVESTINLPEQIQEQEKTIQIKTNKATKNNIAIIKKKPESKKLETAKETVQETVKEPTKKTPKIEQKKLDLIKEQIKAEPIKEGVKLELETAKVDTKLETATNRTEEAEVFDEPSTNWLKLALYILGPIFVALIAKYLYEKSRNNSLRGSTTDYMRRKFKEEQQPAQEETQPDNTEQQSTEEDENNNK